jgi:hypothetical protein
MTKQEELQQLRKFPHHYLWNKKRAQWTAQDLVNLETADEDSRKCNGKNKNGGQPVIQHLDGEKIKFESCSEASRQTGVSLQQIYSAVNGHTKTAGGCKWEKTNY